MTQQCAGDRKTLLLASRDLYTTFSDQRIQAAIGARQQTMSGGLLQYLHTLTISCVRIHEKQVFSDRAREKLGVLSDESGLCPKQTTHYKIGSDCVIEN